MKKDSLLVGVSKFKCELEEVCTYMMNFCIATKKRMMLYSDKQSKKRRVDHEELLIATGAPLAVAGDCQPLNDEWAQGRNRQQTTIDFSLEYPTIQLQLLCTTS